MRRTRMAAAMAAAVLAVFPVVVGVGGAAASTSLADSSAWGKAIAVPGLAALNVGGSADVLAVSCPATGECAASGYYTNGSDNQQGFVVNETGGTWGRAIAVPGLAALGPSSSADTISCSSAGNCAAGGYYTDATGTTGFGQAFVVNEVNGTWQHAIEVPGSGQLNPSARANVNAVSCAPSVSGNCSAGGFVGPPRYVEPVVASETSGRWGRVKIPAGVQAGGGSIVSVSCPAAGACTAVGTEGTGVQTAFYVTEHSGAWGPARPVPGVSALDAAGGAQADAVSCATAASCAITGTYYSGGEDSGTPQAFVADQQNGTWQNAVEVPGVTALDSGQGSDGGFVSCPSAGNCSLGGDFNTLSYVDNETAGTWGSAQQLNVAALGTASQVALTALSCASSVSCSAAGVYFKSSGTLWSGWVANRIGGTWRPAFQVNGLAALNAGHEAQAQAISCAHAGSCALGGYYTDAAGDTQGFVDTQN
jgi:hypothetical protein